MTVFKRSRADPTQAEEDADYYTASVTTDGSGLGGTSVSFDEDFDSAPTVLSASVTDEKGDAYATSVTASSLYANVENGPASKSVTTAFVVAGARNESA